MELLELIISAIKSGVSFMIFTISHAKGAGRPGYAFLFLLLITGGIVSLTYMFEFIKNIIRMFCDMIYKISSEFLSLFKRNTKIEKIEVIKDIRIQVIDKDKKEVKSNILEGL